MSFTVRVSETSQQVPRMLFFLVERAEALTMARLRVSFAETLGGKVGFLHSSHLVSSGPRVGSPPRSEARGRRARLRREEPPPQLSSIQH